MENTYCIIMAGGIGSRFWPLSTEQTPKQFLDILGVGKTLLQLTYERFLPVCKPQNFYIVTNQIYEDLILEQLPQLSKEQILKEPMRRNTAPCIAYGCHIIKSINKDANIIVAPSDHIIINNTEFLNIINTSLDFVTNNDELVTLGIKPSRPDTGYGYIQLGEMNPISDVHIINKVRTFTEKPNLDLAKVFLKSGDFFWNSGIFIWSLSSINKAFQLHLPEVYNLFESELGSSTDSNVLDSVYAKCQNISIDFGIMEKCDNVSVIQSDFGWSDLGTWGALYDISFKDTNNNANIGTKPYLYESNNNVIHISKNKIAVIDGVSDYIIIDTPERLLICPKSHEQKIRQYVNDISLK